MNLFLRFNVFGSPPNVMYFPRTSAMVMNFEILFKEAIKMVSISALEVFLIDYSCFILDFLQAFPCAPDNVIEAFREQHKKLYSIL